MQSLYSYISKPLIDGHVHAFNHEGCLKCPPMTPYAVGFADINLYNPDQYKNMSELYKIYIPKCPWVKYWLATGLDIDSIKKVYEENREYIRGFGELKLYDDPDKTPKNYKNVGFLRKVMKLSSELGNLPVYIHFEINTTKDSDKIENVLLDYPTVPLVLCHLGINKVNHELAWGEAIRLASNYSNIYLDISWTGAKWLNKNPILITQLPIDRCFWGSDMSPKLQDMQDKNEAKLFTKEEIKNQYVNICKYLNSDQAIKRLFKNDTIV